MEISALIRLGFVYSGHRSANALLAKYHSTPPQTTVPVPARRLWPARAARGQACAFRGLLAPGCKGRSAALDACHRAAQRDP